MQIGRAYCRATGIGICGIAIAFAAMAPIGDSDANSLLQLQGSQTPVGGTIAATVSWPQDAAGLDPTDICVVVFDGDGGVVREGDDVLTPIPGQPVAARWTVGGLAEGRYTLYVAQCPSAATDTRRWVEPQYLGGAADSESAFWVDVAEGVEVNVGTIALHPIGLETWPQES